MLDVRYHIFYLGLMFLMLGFGIFIGASVIGPAQVQKQTASIANLRQAANQVVQDRDQARDRLAKDESVLAALRPALVRGKLAGRRVILIQTGDYADATEAANAALTDAGAMVAATVALTDKWGSLSSSQRQALAPIGGGADPDAQTTALFAALASALAEGTGTVVSHADAVQALQQQGLITVSGDLSVPCRLFVVVGGGRDDAPHPPPDGALVDGLKAVSAAVTVIGCEPSVAAVSSVPSYQKSGVATVDCVDLPLGQLALPFALRGDAGDYGIKQTAQKPLPDSAGGPLSP